MARNQMFWVPGDQIFGARNFSDLLGIFNLPQHSLMLRSGHLRNPGFPFFIGRRDPSSALCNPPPGSRHPISGVRDCRLRIPDSAIYIYLLPINRPCGRYVNFNFDFQTCICSEIYYDAQLLPINRPCGRYVMKPHFMIVMR